jgi:type II secretory pathway component PulJ
MKLIRQSYITLLEVLIAMGLTMVLLSVLTFFYRQMTELDAISQQVQKQNFEILYVENRLMHVLPKAVSEKTKKKDFAFFLSPDVSGLFKNNNSSLVFTYDNALVNPEFANHVLGRLFVDNQNRLCLATWPSFKRWDNTNPPLQKEILMENVESLSFEFFKAPDRDKGSPNTEEADDKLTDPLKAKPQTNPPTKQTSSPDKDADKETDADKDNGTEPVKGAWIPEWKQEYKQLPSIVRVKVERKLKDTNEMIYFAFPLPNSDPQIIYNR